MNPFVWLQSLVTFRKSGGGFQVPELDGAGRVQVAVSGIVIGTGLVFVGPAPPGTIDGSVLWFNSTLGTLFFYDTTRGKWLGTELVEKIGGRNGTTPPGNYYRGADSLVLDAANRGLPVAKGTVTSVSWTRTNTGAATLQVLVGGVVVAEVASSLVGATRDDTINADFNTGMMSFRNKSTGANTSDVQIAVQYRRRP